MSLSLLAPIGLLALLGVLVPLALHLTRKATQQRVDFAALRWLKVQARPRRSWSLHERVLLVLRSTLVTLLALLLAAPVLTRVPAADLPWVVVVPGSAPSPITAGAKWRWLSPGFPDYAQAEPASGAPIASLLRELDAQLPADTALTVVAPSKLSGLDGARSQLSRGVQLRVMPEQPTASVTAAQLGSVRVALFEDAGSTQSARYIKATGVAWQTQSALQRRIELTVSNADSLVGKPSADWVIWLKRAVPAHLQAWLADGGTLLLAHDALLPARAEAVALWRDQAGKPLLVGSAFARGRLLQWTQPLSPATLPQLLEPDFPQHLRAALEAPPQAPNLAPSSQLLSAAKVSASPLRAQPLNTWLACFICLVWLAERWLACSPRRDASG